MIRNPIHLSVGEGRHNHTKITWLAGLQMSLIQMSRIRELLTWPTCHRGPFFCTVGLYTHITDYIINFRAYASRDRSVEPDENIGWSRSCLPYGCLSRHIPDSILYLHDHSGGHRSSPDLPCQSSTPSSVIAQAAGTPKRQVIGHQSSAGGRSKAVFWRLREICEIFCPPSHSTADQLCWGCGNTCGKY